MNRWGFLEWKDEERREFGKVVDTEYRETQLKLGGI